MPIDTTGLNEDERALFSEVMHMLRAHFEGNEAEKTSAREAVSACLNVFPKENREERLLTAMWWAEAVFAEEQAHRPHAH